MSDSVIAIRTADRKLVPVLSGPHGTRRRMVLTTVHENQPSVHIDLFQMESEQDQQSDYIGSLVIEHLNAAPAGEPDITLNIGIDEQGNLNATATDSSSGDYQSLSVSLRDSEGAMQDLPDFSLSDDDALDEGGDFDLSDFEEPGLVDFEDEDEEPDLSDVSDFGDVSEFGSDADFSEEPDFSLDENEPGLEDKDEDEFDDDDFALPDLEDDADSVPSFAGDAAIEDLAETRDEGSVPKLLFVAYIVLAVAILTGLVFIVYRLLEGDPVPPLEAAIPLVSPVGLKKRVCFWKSVRNRHNT